MLYWIFKVIFIVLFKLLFRLKAEGIENIPQKTNFIVVANHASFLDPLLLEVAISRKIHWIVLKDILYTKLFWARWFMNKMEALPHCGSSEKAVYLLMKGRNVGLFPEGARTCDGKLREFKRGAALLAIKTGRPILPCAVLGAYEAFPRGAKFPKLLPIKVKIGEPKYLLKEFQDVIDDIYLQEGILNIRNTIKELLHAG